MNMIKVLLVIEVRLIANIFAEVLEDEADFMIVGRSEDAEGALKIIQDQKVDVVLVSVGLPEDDALKLTRAIVDNKPNTKILTLGLADDTDDVLKYVEAGASGYILKDSSLLDMIEIIRSTQKGEPQVSAKMAAAMIERLSSLAKMFSPSGTNFTNDVYLTPRELDVLECIGQGYTNQEIASTLLVELGTVKNHVHSILEKLNVSNRDEAASYLAFMEK
jgi:DNA-binding NarL/FixJ family response regulator